LQAVILVGGEGTRLRPLTFETPKPMVPLFGVPFLERTVTRLVDAGVQSIVLAAGYLPQAIRDYFGDGSRHGVSIRYVIEDSPLGTAGALRNVAEFITGPFFVLNGDIITGLDLRAMIARHDRCGGAGVLHTIRVEDPSAFGCIVTDADGRIESFVEKPKRENAPTDQINAGTYLLEPAVLEAIPTGRSVSIERETFPRLLANGTRLYAFVTEDYWLDVGQPQHYVRAHEDVLNGRFELPDIERRGTFWHLGASGVPAGIRPPAFVGPGVAIDPTAVVGPYVVLGAECRVEAGAHLRASVLWDRVTIGREARVAEAILADDVVVGHDAVVTPGAVIGHGVSIEPGRVLSPDARLSARPSTGAAIA